MNIPNTPQTIIEQMSDDEKIEIWNGAWQRFFDIYHATLRVMVMNSFFRQQWYNVSNTVLDEVVADVAFTVLKIFSLKKYDKSKGKFRKLLLHISNLRTVDFIRRHQKSNLNVSLECDGIDYENILKDACADPAEELSAEEGNAFKNAMFYDVYNALRHTLDPRTCAAFEAIKLEGKKPKDVSEELGVSLNSVNNMVYRVVSKLKDAIKNTQNGKDF
ncbi:MAG: sigma-70 family RNA polymerase sigma factor [Opitutales bacterium]|nr:sigma-70 family RNA polymerase sigma factor [Opitutales bacterium]